VSEPSGVHVWRRVFPYVTLSGGRPKPDRKQNGRELPEKAWPMRWGLLYSSGNLGRKAGAITLLRL